MDPPHMTEFASERYFEKLNQQRRGSNAHESSHDGPNSTASTFILPLRESRIPDPATPRSIFPRKRADKARRFGLLNLIHSKHAGTDSLSSSSSLDAEPSLGPRRKSVPFGQLFHFLPNELQTQILCQLSLSDFLNLRLVSASWNAIVTLHEAAFVRHYVGSHIPVYALRLYPVGDQASLNLHYLCGLWHRLHVAAKLAHLICEWTTKEIFLRTSPSQKQEFAPQRERMRCRLIPILFTIFHFFETYRRLNVQYIKDNDGHGIHHKPYTVNPIELQIMNMYDDATLLRVHEVFPLVISSFCRRLRPPTYAGRVERSVRGYTREKPADQVHVAILCIGGLRQVERLWEVKGYSNRRVAVDSWYNSIAVPRPDPPAVPSRARRGLMGIGRKKSMFLTDVGPRVPDDSATPGQSPSSPSPSIRTRPSRAPQTSLARGMPMGPVEQEDGLQALVADLPDLKEIWLATAEALILDRRIVERAQDISRNAQVMLGLIREDGFEVEDEWWYGCGGHDSLRPAAEEDGEDGPE